MFRVSRLRKRSKGLGHGTGLEVAKLWEAADVIDEWIGDEPVAPVAPRIAVRAAEYDLPAGLVAALDVHLRAHAAADRLLEVLEEVGRVRSEAGWPPLAAPIGQILASQALLHVLEARRYGSVIDEFRELVQGGYGETPEPVDATVERAVALLAPPGQLMEDPVTTEDVREQAEGLAASEEELVLIAMFGADAEELLKVIRGRHSRDSMLIAEDADAERGERIRELVKIVQESGVGEIEIEDEGMRVSVRRADEPSATLAVPVGASVEPLEPAAEASAATGRRHARRVADGRSLLPRSEPGIARVRRRRRHGRPRSGALRSRGDEALQRAQGGDGRRREDDPRRERSAGRVRRAPVRARARPLRARPLDTCSNACSSRTGVRSPCASSARSTSSGSRPWPSTRRQTATRSTSSSRTSRCASARPAAAESYLRISNLVAAAETTGCDAVHPGYGFLAENAEFVRACDDNNVVFIGPPADVVEQMGDKVRAKEAMRAAGVPLVPGSNGTAGLEELRRAAVDAGFPVLLKAAAGGGGKGMRLVESADELEGALAAASAEAEAAFGDGSVYVEKLVSPARHVEIQVLCDADDGVLTLGERECSIQRRHQKLVEESPSTALDPTTREEMESTVERACRAIGYRNAGTFEFLVGPDGAFYFIEVNCRLQVEHPVSELVTGIDIVREQIRIAAGEPLALKRPRTTSRTCDRDPDQRGGSCARLPARPRHDHAVRRPARAGCARRYGRSGRIRDSALLRLDDREAHRVGRHPRRGDRACRARSARGGDRGDPDHTRPRARRSRLAGVQEWRLLDVDADRARGPRAVSRAGMTPATSRKAARRQALYLLYQWDLTGQELASLYEGEPDAFARSLADAVAARAEALDLRITAASPDWPASRLGTLERNILRIGVYELEEETVPREVAINEAVVLAKRYATEDAARLVNGILARVARDEEAA